MRQCWRWASSASRPSAWRIRALGECNDALIAQEQETDSEIDKLEREIESLCLQLLLKQQPVASDLRDISAALKMISDMERIGDQASDIAELAVYLQGPAGTLQAAPGADGRGGH